MFILDEFLAASFIKRLIVAFFYFTAAKTIALFLDAINEIYKQFRPELAKRNHQRLFANGKNISLYRCGYIDYNQFDRCFSLGFIEWAWCAFGCSHARI